MLTERVYPCLCPQKGKGKKAYFRNSCRYVTVVAQWAESPTQCEAGLLQLLFWGLRPSGCCGVRAFVETLFPIASPVFSVLSRTAQRSPLSGDLPTSCRQPTSLRGGCQGKWGPGKSALFLSGLFISIILSPRD